MFGAIAHAVGGIFRVAKYFFPKVFFAQKYFFLAQATGKLIFLAHVNLHHEKYRS